MSETQRARGGVVERPRPLHQELRPDVHGAPERPDDGERGDPAEHRAHVAVRRGQQPQPRQQQGGDRGCPEQRQRRGDAVEQPVVPLRRGARGQPVQHAPRRHAEQAAGRQRHQDQHRHRQPLPPHQVEGAVALQLLGHPVAHPAVGQGVVPAVDARDRLAREGPVGPGRVTGAHQEHAVAAAAAVGHLADRLDAGRQAVLQAALGGGRDRVEVHVQPPLEHRAQPPGELGAARLVARRQDQVAGGAGVVAAARGELDERAHGGARRLGRLGGRLGARGRRRGGGRLRRGLGRGAGREGPEGQEHERGGEAARAVDHPRNTARARRAGQGGRAGAQSRRPASRDARRLRRYSA